jgi:hypothetical protein
MWLGFWIKCLAIPYFRTTTCRTIIGAKRFHCRVRDGIGWFTLAMVTKQTGAVDDDCQPRAGVLGVPWKSVTVGSLASKRQLRLSFRLSLTQTDWVLYGQASRAISTR